MLTISHDFVAVSNLGLLEKIKFDLCVARQDKNQADIRYMINMDYSADLNLNTLGRRIRTRLYFTSESHLHTVLNALRFGNSDHCKSILSQNGIDIINSTPELCYLTQIVMRVFEDIRPEMRDDPRRFRVEVLFSPGATATPLHLDEANRDLDSSRIDTSPLQMIGRDHLTCEEMEDFLEHGIMAGRVDGDGYISSASLSTLSKSPKRVWKEKADGFSSTKNTCTSLHDDPIQNADTTFDSVDLEAREGMIENEPCVQHETSSLEYKEKELSSSCTQANHVADFQAHHHDKSGDFNEKVDEKDARSKDSNIRKLISRKYFWSTLAVGSFIFGTGCLFIAMRLADDSRYRRSNRRYK